MKEAILSFIDTSCPFRGSLHWYDSLHSTNDQAKHLAKEGAPHGTFVIAGSQSAGRGRMGRSFCSPEGSLYLSVILRPDCPPAQLMHLTCWAAVAACDGVQQLTGIRPKIKWINDLIFDKKKLGGILTELSINPKTGMTDYAVIGIGINCLSVPEPVADMATCLSQMTKQDVSPHRMAAAMIHAIWKSDYTRMPECYRKDCITLGQTVKLAGTELHGTALDVTDDGSLIIGFADGTTRTVSSGEVSVRGLYGYV